METEILRAGTQAGGVGEGEAGLPPERGARRGAGSRDPGIIT